MQESFDLNRTLVAGLAWRVFTVTIPKLVNWVLPKELQVYVFPAPMFTPCPGVTLGIAAFVEGAKEMKPGHFVCNVGHIDCGKNGWFTDILKTAETSIQIMNE